MLNMTNREFRDYAKNRDEVIFRVVENNIRVLRKMLNDCVLDDGGEWNEIAKIMMDTNITILQSMIFEDQQYASDDVPEEITNQIPVRSWDQINYLHKLYGQD